MDRAHGWDGGIEHENSQPSAGLDAGDVPAEQPKAFLKQKHSLDYQNEKEEHESVDNTRHTRCGSIRPIIKGGEVGGQEEEGEGENGLQATATTGSAGPPYCIHSKRRKQFIILMASWAGFFSPLSANIYFPALNAISSDLHVSSSMVNLTLTSYMIFQGLAPTFIGDLADMSGRRPAYIIGFVIYLGACIGIALQNSFAALFILRCLQSTGSSGTVALASGVVADISTSSERGLYMGWAQSGILIAPAVGPIIGGILAEFLGWRSIFWFLTIMATVFLIPFVIAFPESGRNVVGNGSIPPQGWNMSLLNYLAVRKAKESANQLERTTSHQSAKSARDELARKRKLRIPNPIATLRVCLEKDIGLLLFYNALVYTAFYDITATIPYSFGRIYGYNDLQIGLSYIPFGVGCLIAPIINGKLLDRAFKRIAAQEGIAIDRRKAMVMKNFPLEKARVPILLPLLLVGIVCIVIWGWVLQAEVNVAVPLVLLFILGITLTGAFNVMGIMLVDYYPMRPATATAANNLVRCSMGAAGTAIIVYMIEAMGNGWCFTLIGGIVLLFSPIPWILLKYGPKWRMERHEREERKDAEKA